MIAGECRLPACQRRYDVELAAQRLRLVYATGAPEPQIDALRSMLRRADDALVAERRITKVGGGMDALAAARKSVEETMAWVERRAAARRRARQDA